MTEYNSKVYTEQGGSVLRADAGASVNVAEGAGLTLRGVGVTRGTDVPTHTANAGDIYFRGGSDAASAANIYINVSDGATGGSVWKGASIFS